LSRSRALDELTRHGWQGNAVELVIPRDQNMGPKIIAELQNEGISNLFGFAQSRPSLGDVYLSATGKSFSDEDSKNKESRTVDALRKEAMR